MEIWHSSMKNIKNYSSTFYIPTKLKWYQRLLQKLHIKNYYNPIVEVKLEWVEGSEE